MLNPLIPQTKVGISHPHVRDAYLKKNLTPDRQKEDVLVLEMATDEHEADASSFDSYLMDLLTDLQSLKEQAEEKVGHIDRIDISRH